MSENTNENTNTPVSPTIKTDPIVNPTANINFDDFLKVKMAAGKVLSAEKVEGSPKLLKLSVDFGKESPRQVLSGIAKSFQSEDLIGKTFVFVINLEPRQIMGMESQAMILAGHDEQGLALFSPTREIPAGTQLG
jgi:methionine--tRNA ligase beta chain